MLQRIRDGLQGQKWLAWIILGLHWRDVCFLGRHELHGLRWRRRKRRRVVDGEEFRPAMRHEPGAKCRLAGHDSSAPTSRPTSG